MLIVVLVVLVLVEVGVELGVGVDVDVVKKKACIKIEIASAIGSEDEEVRSFTYSHTGLFYLALVSNFVRRPCVSYSWSVAPTS